MRAKMRVVSRKRGRWAGRARLLVNRVQLPIVHTSAALVVLGTDYVHVDLTHELPQERLTGLMEVMEGNGTG